MLNLFCMVFVFMFSFSTVHAFTNKTFISARLHNASGMDFLRSLLDHSRHDEDHHVQMRMQYERSFDSKALGRYFGVNETNEVVFGSFVSPQTDVAHFLLIHLDDQDLPKDILDLKPEYRSTSLQCSYVYAPFGQEKNLFVGAFVTVSDVYHKLNASFLTEGDDRNRLERFLYGEFAETGDRNRLQTFLRKAKFHKGRSSSGCSDLRMVLFRKHEVDDDFAALYGVQLILPTGRRDNGNFLFDAQYGNGRHIGVGYLLSVGYNVLHKDGIVYRLAASADYMYLFANHQVRTIGIRGHNYGHYYPLAKRGNPGIQLMDPLTPVIVERNSLIPAANLLTQPVKVLPGSQFAVNVELAAQMKKLGIRFGYALQFAQGERICLKKMLPEEQYAIPDGGFQTNTVFGAVNNQALSYRDGDWLSNKDLDLAAAAIPARLKHSISCNINLIKNVSDTTYMFDVGAMCHFATQNSESSSISIMATFSCSF